MGCGPVTLLVAGTKPRCFRAVSSSLITGPSNFTPAAKDRSYHSCASDADQALDAREPRAADFPDEESFRSAWRAWDAECELAEDRKIAGAITIQENGCGFSTLLAITGPFAGTVWWLADLTVPLSVDHVGGGQPATLIEWLSHGSENLLPRQRGY